jgi:DNA-binding NtrC family response regulator
VDRKHLMAGDGVGHAVVSVSASADDHVSLRQLLAGSGCAVYEASTSAAALSLLGRHADEICAIVCERELSEGSWRDFLNLPVISRRSPFVIVTSGLADNRLWAEVLNLGGYDVLMKPFYAEEVVRIIDGAYRNWRRDREPAAASTCVPSVKRAGAS